MFTIFEKEKILILVFKKKEMLFIIKYLENLKKELYFCYQKCIFILIKKGK